MTPREHSALARDLIAACGGLDEAAAGCRVGKSLLSNYQNPAVNLFMPIDVVACLESYCGKPIISKALFEQFDAPTIDGDLRDSSEEVTEDAADMQRDVRAALAKGTLTPRDMDALRADAARLREALCRVEATIRGAEAATAVRPKLQAV